MSEEYTFEKFKKQYLFMFDMDERQFLSNNFAKFYYTECDRFHKALYKNETKNNEAINNLVKKFANELINGIFLEAKNLGITELEIIAAIRKIKEEANRE